MDIETLQRAAANVGPAALAVCFLTGFLFSFNPVALAAIPVSLAYVTKAHASSRALVLGTLFISGMLLTHVALGVAAGWGGQGVKSLIGRYWGLLLGPWLVLMGLMWPGWLRLPFKGFSFRVARVSGTWGAFVLGVPFAVAVCPACTPALVVLLGLVAGIGSPIWGGLALLAFALGRAVPIALGAGAVGWLEQLRPLSRFQRAFDVLGGVTLVVMGLYMLNAYFFVVPSLAG